MNELRRDVLKLVAFDHIINHLPGNIYWKDVNGVVMGCSLEQAKLVGFKNVAEIIGKTLFDFVDPKLAESMAQTDKQIIESGVTVEVIEEGVEGRYFLSRKAPLRDPDNDRIIGVIGTSLDITKQKELEEQLSNKTSALESALATVTNQKSDLEKANELKDRILRNVSHEVRTPLSGMGNVMYGVLALWNKMSDVEKLKECKSVAKSLDDLQEFVLGMLDISKLKSGTEELECVKNDLGKLARDVIDELSRDRKNISFVVDKNLSSMASYDRLKLRQVFRSLIGNAMKFSEPDAPIVVAINERSGEDGQSLLEVSVTDQGIGVPEDEKYDIFDPFYESKRTRCYSGGTGLGLSLSREIIDAHGGKIWAQPNEVGTTFVFTLPRNIAGQDQLCRGSLRILADQLPGNLYIKGSDYVFIDCNQEQAKVVGAKSAQELIGKTNRELLGEEVGQEVDAVDRRVLEDGELVEVEEKAPDGQYYISKKAPVKNADGKIIGLFGNSVNITKQKTVEFGLKKIVEDLSKKTEDLSKETTELAKENAELKKALDAALKSRGETTKMTS